MTRPSAGPALAGSGEVHPVPGSFRDRRARLFRRDDEILRGLDPKAAEDWRRFTGTALHRRLAEAGELVATTEVPVETLGEADAPSEWAAALRHEVLPFVTHPFEWSSSRLRDAAAFHLRLMAEALAEGFILKDASAYNVQWRGSRPVFIDTPSFEPLEPGAPWVGYRQFCELFLNPLMLQAYKGVPFQPWLRGRLDGIPTRELARLMSLRDLFRPGVFTHVALHARLQSGLDGGAVSGSALQQAGFRKELIEANVRGLRRVVDRLRFRHLERSPWLDYATTHSYAPEEYQAKQKVVGAVCGARRRKLVVDLGCNSGDFSLLAAKHADLVLALDQDEATVDALYRRVRDEGIPNVLALVADVADPSPALGWNLHERLPLLDRGEPDLVICLALLHHLVISAHLPLAEVVAFLRELAPEAVVEFVSPEDDQVQRLLRNKPDIYRDYTREAFEREVARHFRVESVTETKAGLRWLYHLRTEAR